MSTNHEGWAVEMGMPRPFWEMLSLVDQHELIEAGVLVRFAPGSFLCRQGDQSHHVMVLMSGRVKQMTNAYDGYETVFGVQGPGSILGVLGAIDGLPRPSTLLASGTVEVLSISALRFLALCQDRPSINQALLRVLANLVRETESQHAQIGGQKATQKLAALLMDLAIKHGNPTEHGLIIELSLGQQQVASMISVSRETVVRALRDLRDKELIRTERRKITVLSLEGLRKIASKY